MSIPKNWSVCGDNAAKKFHQEVYCKCKGENESIHLLGQNDKVVVGIHIAGTCNKEVDKIHKKMIRFLNDYCLQTKFNYRLVE